MNEARITDVSKWEINVHVEILLTALRVTGCEQKIFPCAAVCQVSLWAS